MSAPTHMLQAAWRRFDPRFGAHPGLGTRSPVERLGRGGSVVMRHRRHIALGKGVRLLRGATVEADATGHIVLHDGVLICRWSVLLSAGGRIEIGPNTLVGDFCSLYGQGGLVIGRDAMLAAGVRIIPEQHTFDEPAVPVAGQPTRATGVHIGDGAWLGANVVVLDGVTIGEGAVIGAGSVVTRDVPPFAVAMGTPARVSRMRPGHPEPLAPASPHL